MKVFFLILYIVNGSSSVNYVKIPFAYSLIPITCEEVFYDKVKFTFIENDGYYGFYKDKIVYAHTCIDEHGNYYNGYEEKLDWELGYGK